MSTMGETTRRSLASVVHGARSGVGLGPAAAREYVGGYGGGLGGTFGRAPTGRGDSAHGAAPAKPAVPSVLNASGRRTRAAPASQGARNLWDSLPANPPTPSRKNATARARTGRPSSARQPSRDPAGAPHPPPPSHGGPAGDVLMGSRRQPRRPASAGARFSVVPGERGAAPALPQRGPLAPVSEEISADLDLSSLSAGRRAPQGTPPRPPPQPQPPARAGAGDRTGLQEGGEVETTGRLRASLVHDRSKMTALHLQNLEEEIRDALKDRRTVYEDSRALLERRFRELDADADGRLSSGELADICGVLGVPVTAAEAEALVDKLGGARGSLPFAAFRKAMLTHPLRQLADSAPVRRGAFVAGQSAAFHGKIIYPPCRTGVFTPSDWDPALAGRSAELPETRLHLEFVYGYDGVAATSPNLFYSASGDPIYSTAGVGVVYLRPRGPGQGHAQRFFLGHDDDVRCLAVLDAPVRVKGREYPARTLAATGQVSSVEHGPVVFVWDTGVGSQEGDNVVARIEFGKSARGIQTLAFSPCGRFLTCVATDNQHTVYVYDWARGKVLSEGMGFSGEPPQVFGVAWDAYGSERFVTFGRKHAKLWARAERGRGWEGRTMSFGKAPICNVTSAAFLPRPDDRSPQYVVCGVSSGSLYVFRDGKCVKEVQAHARGPQVTMPDGSLAHQGVRGLAIAEMDVAGIPRLVLVSGGADGVLRRWDVSDHPPKEGVEAAPPIQLRGPYGGGKRPCIRALDVDRDTAACKILVGTDGCDVFEVTEGSNGVTQEILMDGHEADLWGAAFHPQDPGIFATVCDDRTMLLWSAAQRRVILSSDLGFRGRCCAFSPSPASDDPRAHLLAVGGAAGDVAVFRVESAPDAAGARVTPVFQVKDSAKGITCVRFSPDTSMLAVGGHERHVDVYACGAGKRPGWQRAARCSGHSSTITAVDFSADGGVLQSTSQAYEIIYFDPRSGRRVSHPQRDTAWDTWTCPVGFPVMGIWPEGSDGTDINAVSRSGSGKYLVTAGDDGMVSLFNYPCVVQEAACRSYRGHSSHVMAACFNADDSRVISAGGKDRSVFQFRLEHVAPPPPAPPTQRPVWGPLDSTGVHQGWTYPDADDNQRRREEIADPTAVSATQPLTPALVTRSADAGPPAAVGAVPPRAPAGRDPVEEHFPDRVDGGSEGEEAGGKGRAGRSMASGGSTDGALHVDKGPSLSHATSGSSVAGSEERGVGSARSVGSRVMMPPADLVPGGGRAGGLQETERAAGGDVLARLAQRTGETGQETDDSTEDWRSRGGRDADAEGAHTQMHIAPESGGASIAPPRPSQPRDEAVARREALGVGEEGGSRGVPSATPSAMSVPRSPGSADTGTHVEVEEGSLDLDLSGVGRSAEQLADEVDEIDLESDGGWG